MKKTIGLPLHANRVARSSFVTLPPMGLRITRDGRCLNQQGRIVALDGIHSLDPCGPTQAFPAMPTVRIIDACRPRLSGGMPMAQSGSSVAIAERKATGSAASLLGNAAITLPCIIVGRDTSADIRNLLRLEQSECPCERDPSRSPAIALATTFLIGSLHTTQA